MNAKNEFCEWCGSGPDCAVCGRGSVVIVEPETIETIRVRIADVIEPDGFEGRRDTTGYIVWDPDGNGGLRSTCGWYRIVPCPLPINQPGFDVLYWAYAGKQRHPAPIELDEAKAWCEDEPCF